jgi:hypothetical protein
MTPLPITIRRGIAYYAYHDARTILPAVQAAYPCARIVQYLLGHAIQFRISGAYFSGDHATLPTHD